MMNSNIYNKLRNIFDVTNFENDMWSRWHDVTSKAHVFESFFTNLFDMSNLSIPNNMGNLISPSLSEKDIEMLSKIPTSEKIKGVVFKMESNKALGLDGILAHFFKFYRNRR